MKDFAAFLIIATWIFLIALSIITAATEGMWSFQKSPKTGICYEVKKSYVLLTYNVTMSPVDASYCEKEEVK